jgi:hypothetical protein
VWKREKERETERERERTGRERGTEVRGAWVWNSRTLGTMANKVENEGDRYTDALNGLRGDSLPPPSSHQFLVLVEVWGSFTPVMIFKRKEKGIGVFPPQMAFLPSQPKLLHATLVFLLQPISLNTKVILDFVMHL